MAIVAGLLVVPAVGVEAWNRVSFGTFALAGSPPRIDWCGRRYYPAPAVTVGQPPAIGGGVWRQVLLTPQRRAVYAYVIPPAARAAGTPCAMAVYLRRGAQSFRPYGLSGGP